MIQIINIINNNISYYKEPLLTYLALITIKKISQYNEIANKPNYQEVFIYLFI